jgi:magnesium transporter
MDELESELLSGAHSSASLKKIQQIKKELITIRRTLWQERDKTNDLLRTNTVFIKEHTKVFIRDAYDHSIQLMDIVETYREITYSLMEIYLSGSNNRLNQVMKTLTIISTIFIPLTFIVGVYGMNFAHQNPNTGESMPWNLPELYSPYGYIGVMAFMLLTTLVQLFVFYRKGWLFSKW